MPFRKLSYLLLAVAIIGILSHAAYADTLQVQLTLVNVSPSQASSEGFYVDPYQGQINGGQDTFIWCVDFAHESYLQTTWTVNVTPVAEADNLNTRLGSEKEYLEILWLIANYTTPPINAITNYRYTTEEMQWAIWSFSDPGYGHASDAYLVGLAAAAVLNNEVDPTNWNILTPSNTQNQEFIVDPTAARLNPMLQTPEPGFLLLLGLGIGVVSVIVWLAGGPKR